jgi:phospholipid/cholesterol/gamma-HCH transport system permease protein
MTVTEQVGCPAFDGVSPERRLVVPRVIATVLMMPVLTALADLLGILGGLVIAITELQMTVQDYLGSIWQQLQISDIMSGLGKSFFFGY